MLFSFSNSGFCSREWYEFGHKTSVTTEHSLCDESRNEKRARWSDYTVLLMDWQAFWLTFRLAVIVTAVLLALGLPIAYWIAFSRWRWKFLCEAGVALPIVLPPAGLCFFFLIALRAHSPPGRWWQSMTGHT